MAIEPEWTRTTMPDDVTEMSSATEHARHVANVRAYLKEHGQVTRTTLIRRMSWTKPEADAALRELLVAGEAEWRHEWTGGRPIELWRIRE